MTFHRPHPQIPSHWGLGFHHNQMWCHMIWAFLFLNHSTHCSPDSSHCWPSFWSPNTVRSLLASGSWDWLAPLPRSSSPPWSLGWLFLVIQKGCPGAHSEVVTPLISGLLQFSAQHFELSECFYISLFVDFFLFFLFLSHWNTIVVATGDSREIRYALPSWNTKT